MTNKINSLSEEHKHLIRKVCEKVGSNILLFQKIERLFRVIAPNLTAVGGTVEFLVPDTAEIWQQQSYLKKATFGNLTGQVKKEFQIDGFQGFHSYLDTVLKDRNALVHQFYEMPGSEMLTVAQCSSLLDHLVEQERVALPLLNFATQLLAGVVGVLDTLAYSHLNWFGTFLTDASQND